MSAALHPILSINGHPMLVAAPWMLAATPIAFALACAAALLCWRLRLGFAGQGAMLGGASIVAIGLATTMAATLASLVRFALG